jgi:phosphoglycolate phosphatase
MIKLDIDSIIFDLDGTLWSSLEGVCDVWNMILAKHSNIKRVILPNDMEKCMGDTINVIGKKLFPELDENSQMNLMKECCDAEQIYLGEHGGVLYPKLEDTLSTLSEKYKLFIVSNCQDGYIQCFFKAHKLDKYFTDFECSGKTGLAKGENNKIIIQRNSLRNPIFVGDTNGDAESAIVAGIPFVYAKYGFGNVEKYDYVIESFEDLLTIVT